MEELNEKFDIMLSKISELNESVKFLGIKYEELKTNMKGIIDNQEYLKKSLTKVKQENKEQKNEIGELKQRLEFLEKANLENTLNLYPVLKTQHEDVKEIVFKLGKLINIEMSGKTLKDVYRRPDKKNGNPGEIIVKCNSKEMRDQIIAEVRKKGIKHEDIGIKCKFGRIYANEELTFNGKSIYYKALKLKYEKNWKFVWVKYGHIYVKKEEGGNTIRIDSMEAIEKLL